jgi:hypothetical protein
LFAFYPIKKHNLYMARQTKTATGHAAYPATKRPLPAKAKATNRKPEGKVPTLADLNAKFDANPKRYDRAFTANTLRITGKPTL